MSEDERSFLVSLTASELVLVSSALDCLAAAKAILVHDAKAEYRYRQARAHSATVTKAHDLADWLFHLS